MEWLKEIRSKAKITQESIAALVGIERASYSNIESGERRPSVETAKKIADVLGFDWVLFFPDNKEVS